MIFPEANNKDADFPEASNKEQEWGWGYKVHDIDDAGEFESNPWASPLFRELGAGRCGLFYFLYCKYYDRY